MQERIKACFTESIQTQIAAAEALPDAISRAAMTLVQSLLNGNKILCCGNGTSAANAQHFAASMINRFETERPSLPAIALNTDNVAIPVFFRILNAPFRQLQPFQAALQFADFFIGTDLSIPQ